MTEVEFNKQERTIGEMSEQCTTKKFDKEEILIVMKVLWEECKERKIGKE